MTLQDTRDMTRDEVIALHQRNIEAFEREITRVLACRASADRDRALRNLRAQAADERELIALAKCFEYPYPLKED